jgi:transcriptional regulator with XRE-family HTH domain
MARAALGLGVRDLAVAAEVSTNTITRLERGESPYPRTLGAIRRALESAGIEFIPENGGGAGVRMRKPEATTTHTTDPAHPELRSVGPEAPTD